MSCKGLHCPGCGDGGGWVLAVAVLVVLAVVGANAHAIERGVAELVTAAVIVLGSAVGLVAIAAAAIFAIRHRRRALAHRRAVPYQVTAHVTGRVVPGLPDRAPRAALPAAPPARSRILICDTKTAAGQAALNRFRRGGSDGR